MFILTIELADNADVGAIIVVSDVKLDESQPLITFSNFKVLIGASPDSYSTGKAAECDGGPYLDYAETYSHWPFGAEVWCNLPGKYVFIERDFQSMAGQPYELTLCTIAIFGE